MPYAILVQDITDKFYDDDTWENLTWNLIVEDDELLQTVYENGGYSDSCYKELEYEEKLEYIENSDELYELKDMYSPIINYIHVLQSEPTKEHIFKIYKNAPNVVIIKDNMDNCYIGMSAAGLDLSQSIAYAYMVIDNFIPPGFTIDKDNNFCLKKEAHKELVEFLEKNRN